MSLLKKFREILSPETVTQIIDAVGDDFDWDLVPRTRLNAVIGQRNELRAQLAGQANPNSNPAGNGDEGDDPDGLNGGTQGPAGTGASNQTGLTQADIDKAVRAERKVWENKIKEMSIREATLSKLREAGAIDAELIYDSAKFDKKSLKLNEDGTLEGADDLIKTFQEGNAHLFKAADDGVPAGTGKNGGNPASGASAGSADEAILDAQLGNIFGTI